MTVAKYVPRCLSRGDITSNVCKRLGFDNLKKSSVYAALTNGECCINVIYQKKNKSSKNQLSHKAAVSDESIRLILACMSKCWTA